MNANFYFNSEAKEMLRVYNDVRENIKLNIKYYSCFIKEKRKIFICNQNTLNYVLT
jgi:hypothetical protein